MVVYSILGEGRSPSGSIINYPHRWRGDEGWIERVLFGPRFEKLSLRGWICFCFGKRNFGLGSGLGRFGACVWIRGFGSESVVVPCYLFTLVWYFVRDVKSVL